MLVKAVEINGEQSIFSCFEDDEDGGLTFYLHKPGKNLSFSETLAKDDFQQRLKTLNARVKFPEDAVRLVLLTADPSQVDSTGLHPFILNLKYSMSNAAVPLKWNWHLSPMNGFLFYRKICMNSMATAAGLRDQVSVLIDLLKAKDKELQQYRNDGHKLWRATAVTKTFDVEAFTEEHQKLLDGASAYKKVKDVFAAQLPSASSSALSSPISEGGRPKTPSSGSTTSSDASTSLNAQSSPKLSPRNRKRKALEVNTNHMERKVMQRRTNVQLEYRSSQSSQESNVDEWLTVRPRVKKETIKDEDEEPSTSTITAQSSLAKLAKVNATIGTAQIKCEPLSSEVKEEPKTAECVQASFDYPKPFIPEQDTHDSPEKNDGVTEEETGSQKELSELEELRAILSRTTAVTKKLIKEHEDNK
ncbi:uncharacterized protein [Drosophila takahashii]|uniref:uncharacterized protein n=1 Tax=Drosophila takahashii TaxID=29030 RepID=UPI001CF92E01|nr:uncharacterized protein LOC108065656 [Drosophila takahashii]